MPTIDFLVETPCSRSTRTRQLEAMFDVPPQEKSRIHFKGELPIDDLEWNIGLIVGPSGCGKTSIIREIFGGETQLKWGAASVIDDFDKNLSMDDISRACQAVGFNTIPAWTRPYGVLSNGEKFRVELARRMIETDGVIIVDEFTSVVDRQVAKIGANAVHKYINRTGKQFIAASCHYDIIEWLRPDWTLEPATMTFKRRRLRRRPTVECSISKQPWSSWRVFAPFHYLTSQLHRAAQCFVLDVDGQPAAFAGILFRPGGKGMRIWGCSRLVTLPDYQGLGLAFALIDKIAAGYLATRQRVRTYPAHPALIRSFDKSAVWRLIKKPGHFVNRTQKGKDFKFGGRPNAVFEYCGPTDDEAARLIN